VCGIAKFKRKGGIVDASQKETNIYILKEKKKQK